MTTERIARRNTFALRVFGSAVVNRTSAGLNDGPSASTTQRDELRAQRVVGLDPRPRHHEHPQRLALQLVGHADRGRFEHRRMRDDDRLDLGRTEPLARDLDRVVGTAVQEPLAVVAHARAKSPCHHTPGYRDQYVSM